MLPQFTKTDIQIVAAPAPHPIGCSLGTCKRPGDTTEYVLKQFADNAAYERERDMQLLVQPPDSFEQLAHFVDLCAASDTEKHLIYEPSAGSVSALYAGFATAIDPKLQFRCLYDLTQALCRLHEPAVGFTHGRLTSSLCLLPNSTPIWNSKQPVLQLRDLVLEGPISQDNAVFRAPEAASGNPIPASDVFSFGVIAFEVITGQRFGAYSSQERAELFAGRKLASASSPQLLKTANETFLENKSPGLARMVVRCWDTDATKRPTAAVCRELLATLLGTPGAFLCLSCCSGSKLGVQRPRSPFCRSSLRRISRV